MRLVRRRGSQECRLLVCPGMASTPPASPASLRISHSDSAEASSPKGCALRSSAPVEDRETISSHGLQSGKAGNYRAELLSPIPETRDRRSSTSSSMGAITASEGSSKVLIGHADNHSSSGKSPRPMRLDPLRSSSPAAPDRKASPFRSPRKVSMTQDITPDRVFMEEQWYSSC